MSGVPAGASSAELDLLFKRKARLLQLRGKNAAVLAKLPEREFSKRIKIKSNLVIIATELQNVQDQIEGLGGTPTSEETVR